MVDTNCGWTPDQATAAVAAMATSKPFWVEEPIWPPEDFSSLAALRRATGMPLAMGENATGVLDFRKMVAADATDFVQPSVVKVGGLTNLWRVAAEAEQADARRRFGAQRRVWLGALAATVVAAAGVGYFLTDRPVHEEYRTAVGEQRLRVRSEDLLYGRHGGILP